MTIASQVGDGAAVSAVINRELQKAGLDLSRIKFQQMATADVYTALASGAVDAGWLADPLWLDAAASPAFPATFAFGFDPEEIQGAVVYGPTLLREHRAVGEAFLRAYYTTVREHVNGNYHDNPEILGILADAAEVSPEELRRLPPLQFSALLNGRFTQSFQELQRVYGIKDGILQYDQPLPDSRLLDMGFSDNALHR
ncbi:hypothetical protein AB0L88_39390 [Saccharopolyspora shandongensis]|uniref:hypothetical protein n=1 Tax=Saccharopolyspora shandongensis TaxID=418495 RepID=UPI00344732FF